MLPKNVGISDHRLQPRDENSNQKDHFPLPVPPSPTRTPPGTAPPLPKPFSSQLQEVSKDCTTSDSALHEESTDDANEKSSSDIERVSSSTVTNPDGTQTSQSPHDTGWDETETEKLDL